MASQPGSPDSPDWSVSRSSRHGSLASSLSPSDTASVQFSHIPLPITPASSRSPSETSKLSGLSSDGRGFVGLRRPVTVSFNKGSKLFRLKYTQVEICKDIAGNLKRIELGDNSGIQTGMIHTFPGTKLPIPHLEQPVTSGSSHISRVSFLEEQNIQTASTIFPTQPQYTFETWEDCVSFQEKLLDQIVIFTAGVAEVKSKGRGEECSSQNLRILQSRSGKQIILFFANSQRKEKKRYISIPLNCIDHMEQSRKSGRPLSISLRPDLELLQQLRTLYVLFLDESDQNRFFALLKQGVGYQG